MKSKKIMEGRKRVMEFLNPWLQGIVVAVIIATIIEMIMPNGNNKKYIKVVLGVYVLFNIMAPVINKFSGSKFELSSIMNIEKYTEKMELYNTSTANISIDESNNENIKQIYIANLKNDIKTKLQEKNYGVSRIEIIVENNENYNIKELFVYLRDQIEEKENQEKTQNKIKINEVEKVKIQIGENREKINENEMSNTNSSINEKSKKEIKKYLSSVYEINEQKINIY